MQNNQLKCGDYSILFQCTQLTMDNISTSFWSPVIALKKLQIGQLLQWTGDKLACLKLQISNNRE